MVEPRLVTVLEAAARLGRNPETIRRWIREGRAPAIRSGGQLMLDERDVGELGRRSVRPRRVAEETPAYAREPASEPVRRPDEPATLTVAEAARRLGRNPETVRRWIRERRLRARKIGGQHVVDERDVRGPDSEHSGTLPVPPEWQRTFWGAPMPDVVAAVRRSRDRH